MSALWPGVIFTPFLLIVGGLFLLGGGVFAMAFAARNHGRQARSGRTRANDGDRGVWPWLMADTSLHHTSFTDHSSGTSHHGCGHSSAHGDSSSHSGGSHDCGGSDCGGGSSD